MGGGGRGGGLKGRVFYGPMGPDLGYCREIQCVNVILLVFALLLFYQKVDQKVTRVIIYQASGCLLSKPKGLQCLTDLV